VTFVRLLPLAAVVCVACGSDTTTPSVGTVCRLSERVAISPASVVAKVGDTVRFSASPPTGPCAIQVPSPLSVVWRSSDTAVVTVDSIGGVARARATGTTTILALVVGDSAIKSGAVITVNPR